MPVVLLLAALIVVVTSIWIVIDGLGFVASNAPQSAPPLVATASYPETFPTGSEAPANLATGATHSSGADAATPLEPKSERLTAETGISGHLRD
jgi:hypothetical protein